MNSPNFYAAVYMIIKNEKGEILFLRRKNTKFKEGYLQLPAGHIETKESIFEACIREVKEEINIDILDNDLKIIHISQRLSPDRDKDYFDAYVEVKNFSGRVKINEPNKCSEIKFVDINNLPKDNFVKYDIECIKKAYNKNYFSQIYY